MDVAAEYRLDPLATCRVVELDEAKEIGEVGERQRRHAKLGRTRDGVVDTNDAVGDGILAVQAQMDETGIGHRGRILPRHAPLTAKNRSSKGTLRHPVVKHKECIRLKQLHAIIPLPDSRRCAHA